MHKKLVEISKQQQSNFGCHGYEHTERVIETCKILGDALNADMDILIPAAILHDIGRDKKNHVFHSVLMAKEILKNLDYPKQDQIIHAIEVHSFSANREAKTLEAMILNDADKLDAMGAIGIYRAAQYGVENERSLEEFIKHFHDKLLELKKLLYTSTAQKLAEERHNFMTKYLDRIIKEINGLS